MESVLPVNSRTNKVQGARRYRGLPKSNLNLFWKQSVLYLSRQPRILCLHRHLSTFRQTREWTFSFRAAIFRTTSEKDSFCLLSFLSVAYAFSESEITFVIVDHIGTCAYICILPFEKEAAGSYRNFNKIRLFLPISRSSIQ